jgi:hypothetical protein
MGNFKLPSTGTFTPLLIQLSDGTQLRFGECTGYISREDMDKAVSAALREAGELLLKLLDLVPAEIAEALLKEYNLQIKRGEV